jgi:YebC/PmpR family DNA-binding regulatory protein
MAGHSKWKNIRIRKGRQDQIKSNLFTKLAREITVAAKLGGPDPEANPRLRLAIQKARSHSMPSESIQRAIDKAVGATAGANLEEVVYEGYGPGGVALMVKCLTDNRNRTVAELRHAFAKGGGNLAESGSVSWQFRQRGEISIPEENVEEEALALSALEAGAEDVIRENGQFTVITPVEKLREVQEYLTQKGFPVQEAEIALSPINKVQVSREDARQLLKLLERLDDLDDAQEIYYNTDLPEDLE